MKGNEAIMRKEGDRLIIEPVKKQGLVELLATMMPLDIDVPNVDEDLVPLDDPHLYLESRCYFWIRTFCPTWFGTRRAMWQRKLFKRTITVFSPNCGGL